MAEGKQFTGIHLQILELLKENPEGLTIYEIRGKIPDIAVQQHLDRRVRDLRRLYKIPLKKGGKYVYEGERPNAADAGVITRTMRAAVINRAHGRCQMCGKTVEEDGVKLEADHKVPRNWGGETTLDNLWALCQDCNGGKRDFFASFDQTEMKRLAQMDSVYERIAETLRSNLGKPVPSWFLEVVANLNDFQEDWQKRLRELRYPAIGLKITATRAKTPTGKTESAYQLDEWKPLPPDHKALIKDHERHARRGEDES